MNVIVIPATPEEHEQNMPLLIKAAQRMMRAQEDAKRARMEKEAEEKTE